MSYNNIFQLAFDCTGIPKVHKVHKVMLLKRTHTDTVSVLHRTYVSVCNRPTLQTLFISISCEMCAFMQTGIWCDLTVFTRQ